MHLDQGNNDDADSDETPFFEHNTARVSIFQDEGLAQSAFNIFNHEPRQSKPKSFISKLDIFERGNGDIEERHRSITPADEFIPMTGGRQFYERESKQNSKQKQLFQSRARDTKDKDRPFYLKKQSLEKEKFTFRPFQSTNISFQAHEKNQFQGIDSNMSRNSSKKKEQQFHYMRVESTFNERPIFKKQQENLVNKQTKVKEKEQHVTKGSKESEQRSKLSNINIKDGKDLKDVKDSRDEKNIKQVKEVKEVKIISQKEKESNPNSSKMNFLSNLRKSRAEQKGPGFKLLTQNVFKDSKPIKQFPFTLNVNQNQELPPKKIEETSPKANIKPVQNLPKATGFGELTKKSLLDVNPSKTEKKFFESIPDNAHVKTNINFNKLPSLISSRVRMTPMDSALSDSSSNQSLPKNGVQKQKVQTDEVKHKRVVQITEPAKEDNKGFVLGLKDKLKTFGGPTEKMQMKSIANSKGFQFKPKNIFSKGPAEELPPTAKIEIQPQTKPSITTGSKFDFIQKEVKPNKIAEFIPKRQPKLQPSFPANRSDFSRYMVEVTVLLVQTEKAKVRCNRTKNVFRELSILSNSINEKINRVIKIN